MDVCRTALRLLDVVIADGFGEAGNTTAIKSVDRVAEVAFSSAP